eukprot:gene4761-6841_t
MDTVKVVQRIPIHLYPEQLKDVKQGINERIQNMLNLYNTEFNGVPISYSKIKLLRPVAVLHEDSPILHLQAKVTFRVFSPKEGDKLKGIVNKITIDHVGVLVHKKFNASIARQSLPKSLEYSITKNAFENKKTRETVIEVGSTVNIIVERLESSHGVLSILAKLDKLSSRKKI